jgi:hypothetical protein
MRVTASPATTCRTRCSMVSCRAGTPDATVSPSARRKICAIGPNGALDASGSP